MANSEQGPITGLGNEVSYSPELFILFIDLFILFILYYTFISC
jgi:hypothetical protein